MYDSEAVCPGCVVQIYLRGEDFADCVDDSADGGGSFDSTSTFTAPKTPGVYSFYTTFSWQYSCNHEYYDEDSVVVAQAFVDDSSSKSETEQWSADCSFEYNTAFERFVTSEDPNTCQLPCDLGFYWNPGDYYWCILGFVMAAFGWWYAFVRHFEKHNIEHDNMIISWVCGLDFCVILFGFSSSLTLSIMWIAVTDVCYFSDNVAGLWGGVVAYFIIGNLYFGGAFSPMLLLSKWLVAWVTSRCPRDVEFHGITANNPWAAYSEARSVIAAVGGAHKPSQVVSDSIRVYSKNVEMMNFEDESDECSICMEGFTTTDIVDGTVRELHACGHIFHEKCLKKWVRGDVGKHRSCPLCREAVDVSEVKVNV